MGKYDEEDEVQSTQPYSCSGRLVKAKRFQPKELTHAEAMNAVMIVYKSGDVEVICPICGRYYLA